MKSLKLLFSLLLLAAMPFFAQANPNPSDSEAIVKTEVDGKILVVNLANLQGKTAKLEITSLGEKVEYYRQWVQDHNGFAQRLNLKQLPQGRYLLKVKHDGDTVQRVVKVDETRIWVSH